jgi:hypothetical protein
MGPGLRRDDNETISMLEIENLNLPVLALQVMPAKAGIHVRPGSRLSPGRQ